MPAAFEVAGVTKGIAAGLPSCEVRIEGPAARIDPAESDAYFERRPLGSRLSAAASPQSEVIADRASLEARVRALMDAHPHGHVPRPGGWGGFRVAPATLEFWQGRKNRLHDRVRYRREAGEWRRERLAP